MFNMPDLGDHPLLWPFRSVFWEISSVYFLKFETANVDPGISYDIFIFALLPCCKSRKSVKNPGCTKGDRVVAAAAAIMPAIVSAVQKRHQKWNFLVL